MDKKTIEKYEREAKQRNRESWFLAYIMDTNEEERAKGKTVEQLEAALRQQITRIAQEGVTEAEMKRVKAQWMASTIYQRDSLFNQAREFGNLWIEGFSMDTSDRLVEALVDVTAAQVQAVAQKYFGDDQLTVATLLPQAGPKPALRQPVPGSRHTEGAR